MARRTAKQKAATRKLVAFNKRRRSPPKRRSAPKRRTTRKTIKRKSPRRTMARSPKRRAPSKRGFASKIPLINNPTFRKAATGIGIATLGVAVLGLVAPQIAQNPIVRPALALLGGGVPGVAAQLLTQGGMGLGNILGGGNQGGGGFTPGFG